MRLPKNVEKQRGKAQTLLVVLFFPPYINNSIQKYFTDLKGKLNVTTVGGEGSGYLLEGGGRPPRQAALHQVMPQLPQVEQLLPVVLHRRWDQLSQQADGEHRLRLHTLVILKREKCKRLPTP